MRLRLFIYVSGEVSQTASQLASKLRYASKTVDDRKADQQQQHSTDCVSAAHTFFNTRKMFNVCF